MLRGLSLRAHNDQSSLVRHIDELSILANSTIVSAHEIAQGLLPVQLRRGDFRAVLHWLARSTLRAHKVKMRIRLGGFPSLYPEGRIAEHLFRITQESVSNAIKHGCATRITVSITATRKKLTLSIADDGKPFKEPRSSRGTGLQIMRYRMRTLGGWLDIRPGREQGTRVRCVVPVDKGVNRSACRDHTLLSSKLQRRQGN